MASKSQVLVLFLSLLTLSSFINPSQGGKMALSWGQNTASIEGTLAEACDSDLYDIVALAYLHVSGSTRSLNFDDHCPNGNCEALASQIQHCQSKGKQVLLSVEIDKFDAPDYLAKYLYNNFLSGQDGPLGAVTLDGINIANIDYNSEPWVDLVEAISSYSIQEKKIYISASPRCDITTFDNAIATGHVDYLWVLYYGQYESCEYLGNGDFTGLINSWWKWTSKKDVADSSLFLGLVASNDTAAASYGYITPEDLNSKILPIVKESSKYGGVMLWNRYYDKLTSYSSKIDYATASQRFNSLLAKSA
ncbi:acidic endochitinase SE2-like [Prosopis cineraria]|uniref:acidic endochitinase SE2-like n=1 Tax=Prosopis cineraria TaxID=364024 RepID=UPI00241016FC|nr:acidic endochitinase SE2-like [Prosopis cineraria]